MRVESVYTGESRNAAVFPSRRSRAKRIENGIAQGRGMKNQWDTKRSFVCVSMFNPFMHASLAVLETRTG